MLQFSFTKPELVSDWFWKPEAAELRARRCHSKVGQRAEGREGVQFIPLTHGVSAERMLADLESHGFTMTDAFAQEREDPTRPRRTNYKARFVFHRLPLPRPPEADYAAVIESYYRPSLVRLTTEALWRMRAHRNTLAREGRFGIALDFDARQPFVGGTGERVMQYPLDEAGQRCGPAEPLRASQMLRLHGRVIKLM